MSVIDDYLKDVEVPQRAELERIRRIVHKIVPDATEVISYRIPVLQLQGKYLIGFAAFHDHLSLFPTSEPIEVMRESLGDFKLAKGTIQFTQDNPIPEAAIRALVQIRLDSIAKE